MTDMTKSRIETHGDHGNAILEVKELKQHFPVRSGLLKAPEVLKAVDGVSFSVYRQETFGLVGESGCGKSTVGRTLLKLLEPTSGSCFYEGKDIYQLPSREFKGVRRQLQMVFQDPYSSLNPKKRIGKTLEEPLKIHKIGNKERRIEIVMNLLERIGLSSDHYFRYPHEFSGGQRQRIGLARALVLNPKVVVCDEAVSALDVSIQAQILNLLKEIKQDFKLSYVFISHDLGVVRYISDRVGVMYLGKLVETASSEALFSDPKHPYTQALVSALPLPDPARKKERIKLTGEVPSPRSPPSGCSFHTRCPYANELCRQREPISREIDANHWVACHLYEPSTRNLSMS